MLIKTLNTVIERDIGTPISPSKIVSLRTCFAGNENETGYISVELAQK